MNNKELALQGFQEFTAGNVEILRTLLHEDFVEHNPNNPSGRDAFITAMAASPISAAKFDLHHVAAEGDLVMMHYTVSTPDGAAGAVDVWRFEDGLIVEHW